MVKEVNIKNVVTGKQIQIGGNSRVYYIDLIDWDSPSVSMETYRVPFQIGETLAGQTVGTRKPYIIGYVVADLTGVETLGKTWEEYYNIQEKMIEESKQELDRMISVYQDVLIESNGYYLDARPIQPPKYSTSELQNNEVMCMFTLQFECYSPLFYTSERNITLAMVMSKFRFPLIIPENEGIIFGEIMKRQNIGVENIGDSPVGCEILIRAIGGQIKNPKVYNVNTGEYIQLVDVTLEDGDYITITTETGEENVVKHSISTSENISLIGNIDTGSKFLQIEQGYNYYAYDVAEEYQNNVEISISYNERYFNIRGM